MRKIGRRKLNGTSKPDQKKLIYLSKKKVNKPKFKLLNYLYFKIGFIKRFNLKQKDKNLFNKEIFLGDTDIFVTIGKI